MRLVFAGTPAFAQVALEALLAAGLDVCLVLTQPDRPAGRGMRLRASEVKTFALDRGLRVEQPATLRGDAAQTLLSAQRAQAMVVAAYGLILPAQVLGLFRLGCINIHASLLPRWRGAAPIQRALLAGDEVTGVSIMRMDEGLDTGPVLLQEAVPIAARETARSLHDKLAGQGARLIVTALERLQAGALPAQPQPADGVTYADKITKAEARLDLAESAALLERKVRAFNPYPVAVLAIGGEAVRIWQAESLAQPCGAPGLVAEITDAGIVVCCGAGALRLEVLQRPGGKRLPAIEFARGAQLHAGMRLGDSP